MALPEFASMSLQDSNYITTEIEYRTWPVRPSIVMKVARRPGSKFISEEFGERRIRLRGYIKGSSASDLQSKVDTLNAYLQKTAETLQMEAGRTYTATAVSIAVGDPHYSQDFVPFDLEFLCADPFAYASEICASMTVVSGTASQSFTVTISGSYFAEPTIVYTTPSGSGDTTTSGVRITHDTSGEWADLACVAADQYIDYSSSVTFDYSAYKILQGTTQRNHTGVFSRWEPGTNNFTAVFGGLPLGGTLQLCYSPRYL